MCYQNYNMYLRMSVGVVDGPAQIEGTNCRTKYLNQLNVDLNTFRDFD